VGANLTNVNYFYPDGTPVTGNDFLQNLINLYYSPRPPVFIPTNSAGANDFRFYLDLNRNGRDDPNGWVINLDNSGKVITDGSGNAITNIQVGDPEWVGVLERPTRHTDRTTNSSRVMPSLPCLSATRSI